MKNLYIKAIVLMLLASSCSAPKYSYFFSHTPSKGSKQKNELTQATLEQRITAGENTSEIPAGQPGEEAVVLASTGNTLPSGITLPVLQSEQKKTDIHLTGKVRRDVKSQIKAALLKYKKDTKNVDPDSAQAEGGKNQLVALLLAIFLGAFGVHRFYLGRIKTAILQLLLLLIGAFLLIPLYVLAVWVLIDIIFIAMGKLGPASGAYSKTL